MDKDFEVKEFKIHYEIKKQISESIFADTQDEAIELFEDNHRLEEVELLDIWEV